MRLLRLGSAGVRALVPAVLAVLVCLALFASSPAARSGSGPVQVEYALPGSAGWRGRPAPAHAVEGYASEVSISPGDTLDLHVSTWPEARYRVAIYRLGSYGGSGGRLGACL